MKMRIMITILVLSVIGYVSFQCIANPGYMVGDEFKAVAQEVE